MEGQLEGFCGLIFTCDVKMILYFHWEEFLKMGILHMASLLQKMMSLKAQNYNNHVYMQYWLCLSDEPLVSLFYIPTYTC